MSNIPIIGSTDSEPKYTFVVDYKKKCHEPRLKLRPALISLTLPLGTSEEDTKKYRKLAASIFVQCEKLGFKGTLFGRFNDVVDHKFLGIIMTKDGKEFAQFIDRAGLMEYVANKAVLSPEETSPMISQPTLDETVRVNQGIALPA